MDPSKEQSLTEMHERFNGRSRSSVGNFEKFRQQWREPDPGRTAIYNLVFQIIDDDLSIGVVLFDEILLGFRYCRRMFG